MDLAAVHAFYIGLLEEALGHQVPVPHEVTTTGDKVAQSVKSLENWLRLLDLAISPPMVRDGLKDSTSTDTSEALLRYFCRKSSSSDTDRDKTDFVITFLYRKNVPPERHVLPEMNVDEPSEFEENVYTLLGDEEVLQLPEEHRQLVREFPFVRQEVDEMRTFDELMDSGVIQRVREIKQRFSKSFYHPRVLATIAEYNVYFGQRFDELFKQTAQHIKDFAATVQKQGGSIMSRVDGDVTVKHLTEVKESEVLNAEYGSAQEHFRKISKFKKAVDTRTKNVVRPVAAFDRQPASIPTRPVPAAPVPALAASVPTMNVTTGVNTAVEFGKLHSMEDSIRNFILAADPKSANIVPLKNGNLLLSAAEVEAFRADYGSEKSFRADYASALRTALALQGRFMAEILEFKAKQGSAYLWKPHADALTWLLTTAQKTEQHCGEVLHVAKQRGLGEKATTLNASLQKLRTHVQLAAKALQGTG
jgi:hypothetical protein